MQGRNCKHKIEMTDLGPEKFSENEGAKQVNEFVNKAFEIEQLTIQKNLKTENDNETKTENIFMDFDDLLPQIGEFGRYQKILFLLMIPFASFLVFVYFTQIFITLVPEHWCLVPELENLTVDERFVFVVE